jgi:hypothetical protein
MTIGRVASARISAAVLWIVVSPVWVDTVPDKVSRAAFK